MPSVRRGEFEWIDAFVRALPHARPPQGPGDDAAVLPAAGPSVVTVDAVIEGVHFTRPAFSMEDIGHKALAVNLSDLAAMGARPTWWLCALGLPERFTRAQLLALARGMRPLARRHGLQLIGGNLTRSRALSLTITMAGQARRPLLRSGARAGDLLFLGGALGEAAMGLRLLRQGKRSGALVQRQRRPTPLVALGLRMRSVARAAIDVSDGLLQDAAHLCEASKVGLTLDSAALVPSRALARAAGAQARRLMLSGGEDYALLFAVPPRRAAAAAALGLRRLGRFTREKGLRLDGAPVRPTGFTHV